MRLLGVTRDITQRKQAEQALAERNTQLALAGKIALVGSFAFDIGSGRMQVSPGYAAIHGLPEGTIETRRTDWRTRVHPDDLDRLDVHLQQAIADRRREHFCEYRIVRSGDEIRWIESRSLISYDRDGVALRIVGANIDVTERKQTEAVLEESEIHLADALAAGQVMAFEWDAVTRQSRRSDNAAHILGDETGRDGQCAAQRFPQAGPSRRSRSLQEAYTRALPRQPFVCPEFSLSAARTAGKCGWRRRQRASLTPPGGSCASRA